VEVFLFRHPQHMRYSIYCTGTCTYFFTAFVFIFCTLRSKYLAFYIIKNVFDLVSSSGKKNDAGSASAKLQKIRQNKTNSQVIICVPSPPHRNSCYMFNGMYVFLIDQKPLLSNSNRSVVQYCCDMLKGRNPRGAMY
jgi:hypothetical protein